MDFGDGNIDTVSGKSDSVYYRYSNPGFFPVNLIFIDSLKQCLKSWSDSIFVLQVESKIEHQDTAGCEPFELIVNAETTPANEYKWFVNEPQSSTVVGTVQMMPVLQQDGNNQQRKPKDKNH